MKIIRTLILFIVLCTPSWAGAAAPGHRTVDLIIVAGQSNAVGYDTSAHKLTPSPLDKKVLFWWRCGAPPADQFDSSSNHRWTYLKAQPETTRNSTSNIQPRYRNFHYPEGGFGPEIGLARTLLQNQPQRSLAIIKIAYNGTSATEWQRNSPAEKLNFYQTLVSEIDAAIGQAAAKGLGLHLRALIWVQGESDGTEELSGKYKENLSTMINDLRRDLTAPGLIVLLGFNTRFKAGSPAIKQVVRAQKSLAANNRLITYVDSRKCEMANGVHFSSEGTMELGRLFAEKLLATERKLIPGSKPQAR